MIRTASERSRNPGFVLFLAVGLAMAAYAGAADLPTWKHLSSVNGDLPVPVSGKQQTASLVLDVDKDGLSDIVITERTKTPSVVWLQRTSDGWRRYVVDDTKLRIEAGGDSHDIDGDGDLDLVFGGDSRSNQVWWWENPYPQYKPGTPWTRRLVKDDGMTKHHDELFGDFDGDGQQELVFWNQAARQLCVADVPDDPRAAKTWPFDIVYTWKGGAEHEGLAAADVNEDGKLDVVGGGRWFEHQADGRYVVHLVDDLMRFSRAAAGQIKPGGFAELIFVPGDADGPLRWYEWEGAAWVGHTIEAMVVHGHSLDVGDVNGDGHLDIFVGEMGAWGRERNDSARTLVFYGDGKGRFTRSVVATGQGNHESRLRDLDGDSDLDILQKPYGWETPRLDVWLNLSDVSAQTTSDIPFEKRSVDEDPPAHPWAKIVGDFDGDGMPDVAVGGQKGPLVWYAYPSWRKAVVAEGGYDTVEGEAADIDGDGDQDIVMGGVVWYENPRPAGEPDATPWEAHRVGHRKTHDVEVADLDGDGKLDIVTRNQSGFGHRDGNRLCIWKQRGPESWLSREMACPHGEGLRVEDLDRDGDPDLVIGGRWYENTGDVMGGVWTDHVYTDDWTHEDAKIALGDLNGDGRLDIVLAPAEASGQTYRISWFEAPATTTDANWTEHVIVDESEAVVHALGVGDMNGDGKPDVVIAEMHQGADPDEVRVHVNRGGGRAWTSQVLSTKGSHDIVLADIGCDDDLDIVGANHGGDHKAVELWENQGN